VFVPWLLEMGCRKGGEQAGVNRCSATFLHGTHIGTQTCLVILCGDVAALRVGHPPAGVHLLSVETLNL